MIILLIISLVILSGLIRVNASETWIGNVKYGINSYFIYDLSEKSFTNKDYEIGSVNRYSNTDKIYWYQNSAAITIGNNGIMSAYNISQRTLSGYLYQLTFYACSNKRIYYANTTADLFVGGKAGDVANRPANSVAYQATNITELLATDANYCAMYTTLFVPNTTTNGSWVGLRLRASGNNITGLYFTAFGYDIQQLGLYNKTIEDIINGSDFAKASSVEEVKNITNTIKQEAETTNEIISQDHEYNNNASESTENEKQQMESYEQEEDTLRNGLDLNIEESEITINPEANTFIWEIVNKLRGMSSKIVLLFTSVLSLGIMKMILGR